MLWMLAIALSTAGAMFAFLLFYRLGNGWFRSIFRAFVVLAVPLVLWVLVDAGLLFVVEQFGGNFHSPSSPLFYIADGGGYLAFVLLMWGLIWLRSRQNETSEPHVG